MRARTRFRYCLQGVNWSTKTTSFRDDCSGKSRLYKVLQFLEILKRRNMIFRILRLGRRQEVVFDGLATVPAWSTQVKGY